MAASIINAGTCAFWPYLSLPLQIGNLGETRRGGEVVAERRCPGIHGLRGCSRQRSGSREEVEMSGRGGHGGGGGEREGGEEEARIEREEEEAASLFPFTARQSRFYAWLTQARRKTTVFC